MSENADTQFVVVRPPQRQASSEPETDDQRPRKRRSRAQVACRLCRERKTRCDNRRPTCGYCSFQGVKCDYPDGSTRDLPPDASNNAILERVNHAVALLEELKNGRDGQDQSYPTVSTLPPITAPHETQPLGDQTARTNIPGAESPFTDDGFGQLEVPEAAARTSACESILRWPALDGLVRDRSAMSFALEATFNDTRRTRQQGLVLVQQDYILPLCRKFLELIHFKNPILDVSEFSQYARNAAEYGPGWDEAGCLVLLACALACVAAPYSPDRAEKWQTSLLHETGDAQDDVDIDMAESFFGAAQRRLGLLSNTLVAVQCQYLAGLYEKFLVRPLEAWSLLQGASAQLQAYLYAKGLVATTAEGQSGNRGRHIEQRLYWSCVKAECELRIELQLPSSGLLKFKYPDLFPSLALPSTSALQPLSSPDDSATSTLGQTTWSPAAWQGSPSTPAAGVQTGSHDRSLQPEEERSWLHYLAEISLRSIMNRVLTDLYAGGESQWLSKGNSLLRRQAAYVEELELWHTHLPPQLAFPSPFMSRAGGPVAAPSNELSFLLMTRYVGVMEWIHRPSLYVVIHASDGEPPLPQVLSLAQRGVVALATLIRVVAAQHRHGGIWGLVRRSFGAAMLLAATTRVNGVPREAHHQRLTLPEDWVTLVRLSLATLQLWRKEDAGDLKRMHGILEDVLEEVG